LIATTHKFNHGNQSPTLQGQCTPQSEEDNVQCTMETEMT